MEILAEIAGHPERSAQAVHTAGSKGKGTVTGMIAALLEAGGIKTALYTSPDLGDRRERITRGGIFFDEDIYRDAGTELLKAEEELRRASRRELFDPEDPEGEEPTFFELMTLYFFLCARAARCRAMALETGMGGRLDATNIVDPLVSVITLVEKEHTEYLGNTIREIAGEKAGIIKRGKPLVLAAQGGEALAVFKERAALMNAQLFYLPGIADIEDTRISPAGTSFTLDLRKTGLFAEVLDISVPIPGAVQAQNAAQAVIAAKLAFPSIGEAAVKKALKNFTLPARFEKIMEAPVFIIDGAHTSKSVELCVQTFTALYGNGGVLLFGCASGKDLRGMAETLVPHFSRIVITRPGTFKQSDPAGIFEIFRETAGSHAEIFLVPDTEDAVKKAISLGEKIGKAVLGTGSFYLCAEIRKL
jgi:dihydrofolate synthase/folylpolyglutamate synthase